MHNRSENLGGESSDRIQSAVEKRRLPVNLSPMPTAVKYLPVWELALISKLSPGGSMNQSAPEKPTATVQYYVQSSDYALPVAETLSLVLSPSRSIARPYSNIQYRIPARNKAGDPGRAATPHEANVNSGAAAAFAEVKMQLEIGEISGREIALSG